MTVPDRARREDRRRALWRCALAALLPAAIVLVLIAAWFDAGPRQFLPFWTDEVVYWNETAVFAEARLEGGYITMHEYPAPVERSRFGPHGPLFAVFHGAVARVAGLRPYSAFLVNLVVVSLAAFAWLRGSAAGVSPAALLLLAAFWPLLLYLPTNMQEPTHFALAFLFALSIERRLDRAGLWTHVWTVPLLAMAALLRPSWALLILPLGWRRARRAGWRGVAVLLLVTVAASAAASRAFDALASPSDISVHVLTSTLAESPLRVPALLATTATRNLGSWFALDEDRPPEIALRYFTALLLVVLLVRTTIARPPEPARAEALELALLALGPAAAAVIGFGEVLGWRDFRVLAPHVLIALLLLASTARWERWLWAGTLVLLPLYHQEFLQFHRERFTSDPARIAAMRDATSGVMAFTPGAPPWTNTVVVPAELLQYPLLGLPRGIGISYAVDWQNMEREIRSAYLLLRPQDREELEGRLRMEPLAETPLGTLYRNAGS